MHLLYDFVAAQPLSGRYHGGAEYCRAVFEELIEIGSAARISAFYDPRLWIDPELRAMASRADVALLPISGKAGITALVRTGTYDRIYSALPYDYYDIDFSGVDFVCTIHGLRPIELPTDEHEARYGRGGRAVLRAAIKGRFRRAYARRRRSEFERLLLGLPAGRRMIVVPSEHTKYSLLGELPALDAADVRVYYSPAKALKAFDLQGTADALFARLGIAGRSYFLILSSNRWVKNAIRAIEALDALFDGHPDVGHRVVVLGADRNQLRVRIRNEERFVFQGYVEPPELEALYSEAFALVFPTLNEGFGYPPLEAMRYGTPVICSAVGATTEVCADAALYINPWLPDELRARALMLALDEQSWQRMSQRGRARSAAVVRKQTADVRELALLLLAEPAQRANAFSKGAHARGNE